MGLRKRFFILFSVMLFFIGVVLMTILNRSHQTLVEEEATRFSHLITNQVLAERLAYSKIVKKLQTESKGASEFSHELGFIPLPAQYIRSVSQHVAENTDMYSYSLISEWNINKNQGLSESFDKWAWDKLKEQEFDFKKEYGAIGKAYPWKPIHRIETENGQKFLKVMTADPASSPSCVNCHNKMELTKEIKDYRNLSGVQTEKQWKLHDLMGAIKVVVPLETVAAETVHVQRDSLVSLSVMLLICFGILVSLFYVKVINPIFALTKLVKRVSGGDLEVSIESENIRSSGEIQELTESFGSMVNEIKSSQEKIKDSLQRAEVANKAKSEFLANMSHEIRTPLNSIIGYSDILLDDELSVEQRNMLETVQSSSNVLLSLINDILDLSKIEAGEMTFEEIPFNIENVLFEVNESSRGKTAGKKVELHVEMNDVNPFVIGDPTRFKQIFTNLVGNAIKFTEYGEVITSVSQLSETEENVRLKFSVKDTGIGIPEDKQAVIFEAFRQADGSTTREYGGTGLGLNITRKIIEGMGGKIEISSRKGFGSEFFFELELKKAGRPSTERLQDFSELQEKMVLIVDDNKTTLKIIESYCRDFGLFSITAENFKEAVAAVEKEKIDLVVLDIMIPEKNGFEIKEAIEKKLGDKKPKIIAATSDISSRTLNGIKEGDFDGYLLKPIRKQLFGNLLLSLFSEISSDENKPTTKYALENQFRQAAILIAEDNKTNQKLAQKMISKMGHKVDIVENGLEAVNAMDKNKYDLIFMDMQMPVMDGLEATRRLRDKGVKTPVIALTANAFNTDKENCLEAGMDDFTTKPLNREAIQSIIHRYCAISVPLAQKRVLLVEDDKTSLETLKIAVRKCSNNVIIKTADNGIDACTKVGSFLPHLIILDLKLPDLDGAGVLDYLSKSEKYGGVDVVVLTALPKDDELRVKAASYRICKAVVDKGSSGRIIEVLKEII